MKTVCALAGGLLFAFALNARSLPGALFPYEAVGSFGANNIYDPDLSRCTLGTGCTGVDGEPCRPDAPCLLKPVPRGRCAAGDVLKGCLWPDSAGKCSVTDFGCLSDADCEGFCSGDPDVPCNETADCTAAGAGTCNGQTCDLGSNDLGCVCTNGGACSPTCTDNADCPGSGTCNADSTCVVECTQDNECPQGLTCGAITRQCVRFGITVNGVCSGSRLPCEEGFDCPLGELCRRGLGICATITVSPCTVDADCPTDVPQTCDTRCVSAPLDCLGFGQTCEIAEGQCETATGNARVDCLGDSDCDAPEACIGFRCAMECTTDADCTASELCQGGLCLTDCNDCANGDQCDFATNQSNVCGGAQARCSDGDNPSGGLGLGLCMDQEIFSKSLSDCGRSAGLTLSGPRWPSENPGRRVTPQRLLGEGFPAIGPIFPTRTTFALDIDDPDSFGVRRIVQLGDSHHADWSFRSRRVRGSLFNSHIVTYLFDAPVGWDTGSPVDGRCTLNRQTVCIRDADCPQGDTCDPSTFVYGHEHAEDSVSFLWTKDVDASDPSIPDVDGDGQLDCPPLCGINYALTTFEVEAIEGVANEDREAGIQLALNSLTDGPAAAGDVVGVSRLYGFVWLPVTDMRCFIGGSPGRSAYCTGAPTLNCEADADCPPGAGPCVDTRIGRCANRSTPCDPLREGSFSNPMGDLNDCPGLNENCLFCGGQYLEDDPRTPGLDPNPLALPLGYNDHGFVSLGLRGRIGGINGVEMVARVPLTLIQTTGAALAEFRDNNKLTAQDSQTLGSVVGGAVGIGPGGTFTNGTQFAAGGGCCDTGEAVTWGPSDLGLLTSVPVVTTSWAPGLNRIPGCPGDNDVVTSSPVDPICATPLGDQNGLPSQCNDPSAPANPDCNTGLDDLPVEAVINGTLRPAIVARQKASDADASSPTLPWVAATSVRDSSILGEKNTDILVKVDFLWCPIVDGAASCFAVPTGPAEIPPQVIQTLHRTSPSSRFSLQGGADPVDLQTGSYVLQVEDLALPTRGLPLDFTRTYHSAASMIGGPLGFGWTHTYNMSISTDSTGALVVRMPDGRFDRYVPTAPGAFDPPPGIHNTLSKNPGGFFTLTTKERDVYSFDPTGRLASLADRNGNVTVLGYTASRLSFVVAPDGRVLSFSYDGLDRITRIRDPLGRSFDFTYGSRGDLIEITDPIANTTSLEYDLRHRIVSIRDPLNNSVIHNAYDATGRVVQQIDAAGGVISLSYEPGETLETDALARSRLYGFDSDLRITSLTDSSGGIVKYTYDENGDLIRFTDELDSATSFSYDRRGNLTGIADALADDWSFTYDEADNLIAALDPLGQTTVFAYDAAGNLIRSTDPLGGSSIYAYNSFGQITSVTDANGHRTTVDYDTRGYPSLIVDPLGNSTTLVHDAVGRIVKTTDSLGHVTSYTYDALDRLVALQDPLGNLSTYAYDTNGNVIAEANARGVVTSYTFEPLGHLASVLDGEGGRLSYDYDLAGNLTVFTGPRGHITQYSYDDVDRLVRETDPLGRTILYAYDAASNLITRTDGRARLTEYSYDALHRLVHTAYADGTSIGYVYDAIGNLGSMTDSTGTTILSYDALSRLTGVTDPLGREVRYSYDGVDNRVSMTYPGGNMVHYTYDAGDRLVAVTDWRGRTTTYAYDSAGRLVETHYGNGLVATYAWDAADQLLALTNVSRRGKTLASSEYELDAVGNRLRVRTPDGVTSYSYDNLGRLTQVQPQDGAEEGAQRYEYDGAGNRTRLIKGDDVVDYSYDAADQLLMAGGLSFRFDSNGNQTGCGDDFFVYDEENRLVRMEMGGKRSCRIGLLGDEHRRPHRTISSYEYNGFGLRIARSVGKKHTRSRRTRYVWDLAAAVPVVIDDGKNSYVYGVDLIEAIKGRSAKGRTYLRDGLGSVVAMADRRGKVKASVKYDVFGRQVGAKSLPGDFGFAGEQVDSPSGLIYLRARHYDPITGRFLSADPGGRREYTPYSYARANPTSFVDPLGDAAFRRTSALSRSAAAVRASISRSAGAVRSSFAGFRIRSSVARSAEAVRGRFAARRASSSVARSAGAVRDHFAALRANSSVARSAVAVRGHFAALRAGSLVARSAAEVRAHFAALRANSSVARSAAAVRASISESAAAVRSSMAGFDMRPTSPAQGLSVATSSLIRNRLSLPGFQK